MGGYKHDKENFKQAVVQINELNPDFVVICGDLVHDATDSSYVDFLKIKKEFKMPCHVAAALSVTLSGAQPSVPYLEDINQFISKAD